MKKAICLAILLFCATAIRAQNLSGQFTVQGTSANCSPTSQTGSSAVSLAINTSSAAPTSVAFATAGTYSATTTFYVSANNGATWTAFAVAPSGGGANVTSTTGNGNWTQSVNAYTNFCAVATTWASGTVLATIQLATAGGGGSSGGGGSGFTAGNDLSGTSTSQTVIGINSTLLSALGTGLLYNTTATGVPSIASQANLLSTCADCLTYHTPATGIARTASGSQAIVGSELSGDATTSGSNAVTVVKINGTSFAGTSTHLVAFGAANIPVDSGIVDTAAGLLAACTGCAPLASPSLTTPTIGVATGTSLVVTGIVDGTAPVNNTTTTACTLGLTASNCGALSFSSGYTFNQEGTAGTGVTYTLPATVQGKSYCVANSIVSGTGAADTGVLTVYPPASSYVILNGVRNTIGGGGTHGVASGGAAGDAACFVANDATDWTVYVQRGTWTAN